MAKKSVPKLVKDDPWLQPYQEEINNRIDRYTQLLKTIEKDEKSLKNFSSAYKKLGINYSSTDKGWFYREWAPEAYSLSLVGDFNNWDKTSHVLSKKGDGFWELFIPQNELEEGSLVKVHIKAKNGEHFERKFQTMR